MATELIAAKMVAPFFGQAIYVWASVLGITLGGLALGYFSGGILASKSVDHLKMLVTILLLSGILLIMMPFTGNLIMSATIGMGLKTGILISLSVYFLPLILLMGTVSPLVIHLLNEEDKEKQSAGNIAGNIYALSTTGGVLATFIIGFVLLGSIGIRFSALIFGVLLICSTILLLIKNNQKRIALISVFVTTLSFLLSGFSKQPIENIEIIHQEEGVMGQLKVIEFEGADFGMTNNSIKALLVNNSLQTFEFVESGNSLWIYPNLVDALLNSKENKKQDVLQLGLGAGTLAKYINSNDHNVTAVEFDTRIANIAKEYFALDNDIKVIVDDARHFLNTNTKKYDTIIFDCFLGESIAPHLITKQSLQKLKNSLNPNGQILINFYGFTKGDEATAGAAIYNTLVKSDFELALFKTNKSDQNANLVMLASLNEIDDHVFNKTYINKKKNFEIKTNNYRINIPAAFTESKIILTDEKPEMDILSKTAGINWRKQYIDMFKL